MNHDGTLYHATPADNLQDILENGLKPGSFLGVEEIVDYYAEDIEDNGDVPVILAIDLETLTGLNLVPDLPGIEEPLTFTLKRSEEDIWGAWEGSDKSWQACLGLIGSVTCEDRIPAELITVSYNPNDPAP